MAEVHVPQICFECLKFRLDSLECEPNCVREQRGSPRPFALRISRVKSTRSRRPIERCACLRLGRTPADGRREPSGRRNERASGRSATSIESNAERKCRSGSSSGSRGCASERERRADEEVVGRCSLARPFDSSIGRPNARLLSVTAAAGRAKCGVVWSVEIAAGSVVSFSRSRPPANVARLCVSLVVGSRSNTPASRVSAPNFLLFECKRSAAFARDL